MLSLRAAVRRSRAQLTANCSSTASSTAHGLIGAAAGAVGAAFLAVGLASASGDASSAQPHTGLALRREPRGVLDRRNEAVFTSTEVSKNNTAESCLVTFGDDVYDVTEFIDAHPGGKDRIMMAAGAAVDPFWAIYQQHMTPEVRAG